MGALLIIFGLSFGLCVLLTPPLRRGAIACGLLDHPDGHRKVHIRPTPLAGGITILLASLITLAAAVAAPGAIRERLAGEGPHLIGLLLGALIICGVGLIDDFRGLRARSKVLGQLLAVGVLMPFGFVVHSIRVFHWEIDLGPLAWPCTALWLLGTMNSLNLIDGMDGLLSCLGLILSAATAAMALLADQWGAACVAVVLAGALLGFLCFNFPPASVFLGDAGSMLIGLVLGVLAIQGSLKGPATMDLMAPVALMTLPFFDTGAAIVRRRLTGQKVCEGDRGHLHHCLLRQGFSSRRVLGWVSVFAGATAAGAWASLFFHAEVIALLSALTVVMILVTTRLFGYLELVLLKERLATRLALLLPARSEAGMDRLDAEPGPRDRRRPLHPVPVVQEISP